MIVTITGKHIKITDAMRAHIETRPQTSALYEFISQVDVIVKKPSVMQSSKNHCQRRHCDDVVAHKAEGSLYALIY